MGAPLNIAITYASEKGGDINGAEADANFHALVAAIQTLATMGIATGISAIEVDPNTNIVTFVDSNNNVLGALTMPARPVRAAGVWAAGVKYAAGDVVRINASATVPLGLVALVPGIFTSDAADPAKDLASGALTPMIYDGKPAQTQRGTYSDTYAYAPGDTVFYPPTGTYYQLYLQNTPAGSKPNGFIKLADGTVTFPWAPVSVPVYRVLRVRADGKPAAGGLVQREMMDRYAQFGVNFTASLGNGIAVGPASNVQCKTAPTGGVQFTVKVNGTIVGYIAIAAGKTIAGFATVNATQTQPINLSPGDLVEIYAPATQDSTFADVYGYLTIVQY